MRESMSFRNDRGLRLAGTLVRPDGAERPPVVVFVHGRGSGKGSPRNVQVAERLHEAGLAYLLFDLSGHGDSEGDAATAVHEDFVCDVRAAVDAVYHARGLGPVGVAGAEAGAAAALAEACEDPRVECLALRAPSEDVHAIDASCVAAPTLIVQGTKDPESCRRLNLRIAAALPCEHKLLTVAGSGPHFRENGAFDVVVQETVDWFGRHLA